MNSDAFIADQRSYLAGSYEQFAAFGGPSIYFHHECLRAGREDFLEEQIRQHEVTAPKAMDNAIVNYIRIVAANGASVSGP